MTSTLDDYTLRIESFMLNPPKPIGVGVFFGNKIIAYLKIEQLREIVKRWDEMEAARDSVSAEGAQ